MGERSECAPGTFSWTDLATTDQDAAKAFYTGLFGWEAEDMPVRRRLGLLDDEAERQGRGRDRPSATGAA